MGNRFRRVEPLALAYAGTEAGRNEPTGRGVCAGGKSMPLLSDQGKMQGPTQRNAGSVRYLGANSRGGGAAFSDDEINALMLRLPEFKQWIKQIEAVALETLERGDELPDFKLVRGKSNRRWVDADKVDTYLKGQGLKDKERYTRKLLSPAQAEKALKDKLNQSRVRTNFDKLWEKPEGKLSWALKADPRPASSSIRWRS